MIDSSTPLSATHGPAIARPWPGHGPVIMDVSRPEVMARPWLATISQPNVVEIERRCVCTAVGDEQMGRLQQWRRQ